MITDFAGIGNVGLTSGQGNDTIALLASPSAATVRHELDEEFAADPDLENEARMAFTSETWVT